MQSRCSITGLALQPCPNSRYRNICSTTIGWCCYLCFVTQLRGVCSPDAIRRSCRLRLGPLALADFWIRYEAPPPIPTSDPLEPSTSLPLQQVQVDFPASGYIDAHLSCNPVSLAFASDTSCLVSCLVAVFILCLRLAGPDTVPALILYLHVIAGYF